VNPGDADQISDDADDRALDALLATARWPEPSAASEQRLREAWDAIARRESRGRRWFRYVAGCGVAAAIAVAAVLLPHRTPPRNPGDPGRQTITQLPVRPAPAGTVQPPTVSWRPATAWELALVQPRRATATRPARAAVVARPDSLIARVDAELDAIAVGSQSDVARVAAELTKDFAPDRIEQRLTPVVVGRPGPRRTAALRLLARVATPRSAPLLASLAGNAADRPDAIVGLLRVGDVPTLTALASSASDDGERRQLLAALLRRDPARSVSAYLGFLSDPAVAPAALAALDDVPAPPVEVLFAALNDPRRATRLAAARALGRIDGPFVTARLAAMVRANVNRREALAALASSDGPEAKAFFEWAMSSKELGAYARTARAAVDQL
jgi:hypothetical protein